MALGFEDRVEKSLLELKNSIKEHEDTLKQSMLDKAESRHKLQLIYQELNTRVGRLEEDIKTTKNTLYKIFWLVITSVVGTAVTYFAQGVFIGG